MKETGERRRIEEMKKRGGRGGEEEEEEKERSERSKHQASIRFHKLFTREHVYEA